MGHRIIRRARAAAIRASTALTRRAVDARAAVSHRVNGARAALTHNLVRAHTAALRARTALAARTGQGTVEYVALILLVAGLFATVVVAAGGIKGDGIARAITDKIKSTIDSVGAKKG